LTRVDLVDEITIRQLREIGCWKIYYGAESGSQQVLDAMEKGIKIEEIYEATRITRAAGIQVGFFIMFGYPGEELADIGLTEKMLKELKPETAGFSVAYPLKGTPFYEKVKAQMPPQQHQWVSTNENRLLFQAHYPNRYYHLTIRRLQKQLVARQRPTFHPGRLVDYGKAFIYDRLRHNVLRQSEQPKGSATRNELKLVTAAPESEPTLKHGQ
jgi:radical SAM superfamily enzyme YgiQ (UPF0313 family)